MIKKLHLSIGIICMIIFLLTGQYFQHALDQLQNLEDTQRLLYRTTHVYLFFAAFINIIFGIFYIEPQKIKWTTVINQCFILLSPLMIVYSFFFETLGNTGIDRNIGSLGVIFVFVWLLNVCLGKIFNKVANLYLQIRSQT